MIVRTTAEITGTERDVSAKTMYLLNGHEPHRVSCHTQLRMLCVFNPPVTGREVHDDTGAYPPAVSAR
ncbi:MAG: ectoine synthase [Mycolicibacterium sp.]